MLVLVVAGSFAWWFWRASSEESPVYLSIGDGTQYGCCSDRTKSSPELFRQYLADRLGRDVLWVTTATGYQTSDDFIRNEFPARACTPPSRPSTVSSEGSSAGAGCFTSPQLDRAVQLIKQYRGDHRTVAAITLSIGGNDLVEVGRHCSVADDCRTVYFAALDRLKTNLDRIYARIADAKDPKTPLLVLLYYNASDCGQPGVESSPAELGVLGWNAAIRDIATRHGATLVDLYVPFKGNACKYIVGLDANDAGHAIIAEIYERAYETATN